MEMYHFVTRWFFQVPVERLWEEYKDIESWPGWFQSLKGVSIQSPELPVGLGTVADCVVKGFLPYTLRFQIEVTTFEPPSLVEVRSSGALVGGGKLVLEPQAGGTAVAFHWDVGTTNPILNLLGKLPFAKAMMERNHNHVMANGYRVLKARLEG